MEIRRDVFQAISDPIRREIVDVLYANPLTVNEVAERFDISRPAVSKHLKILDECGLVSINQKGRERYCMINPKSLIPAFMWLDQYRKLWEDRLDAFEDYVNQLKSKQEKDG